MNLHFFEITVLSAEDLTLPGHRIKNAFASISTNSDGTPSLTTAVDGDGGGSNPLWNKTTLVPLSPSRHFIVVEVQCNASMGTRSIGKAYIPVLDFYGGMLPANYLHFLSYRLRDKRGERNGIVNISVRQCLT